MKLTSPTVKDVGKVQLRLMLPLPVQGTRAVGPCTRWPVEVYAVKCGERVNHLRWWQNSNAHICHCCAWR